jgi:aspartate/methionine/tyrosine aminotransferase
MHRTNNVYFATLPGAFERTITCNSLSKIYSITGWRLGYVQAAPAVITQAKKVHDFLPVGAAAPLQEAAVAGLELPESYYVELRDLYTAKRDLFLGLLRKTGLSFTEPQGAYFVMLDISSLGFATDTEASEWLIREPVNHLMCFHFARSKDTLREAGEHLLRLR